MEVPLPMWVILSIFAAFFQAFRNAFQSKLSKSISVSGVTLARFVWSSPLAGLYLLTLYAWQPSDIPDMSLKSIVYVVAAAIIQITATAFMVMLFKQKNYAVGAGLAKCEAPMAALLGVLFFGTTLSLFGWIGVLIGGFAVLLLSTANGLRGLSLKTVILGLACSMSFALTSLWAREASLSFNVGFPHNAAWTLFFVIVLQTIMLTGYLFVVERPTLSALFKNSKLVVATSIASFLASLCWFSAMALINVASVKTVGQIEILFMIFIGLFWLKETPKMKDMIALLLIGIAALLVIWS